jgi:hypothetical protein
MGCREEDAKRLGLPAESTHSSGCLLSEAPLALSSWRTKNTINILVSKPDAEIMLDKVQQLEHESQPGASMTKK